MSSCTLEQVTDAIAECKDAGIRVIMITGDNKLTAEAVARDIGIFGPETDVSGRSITGAHHCCFHQHHAHALLMLLSSKRRCFTALASTLCAHVWAIRACRKLATWGLVPLSLSSMQSVGAHPS